MILPSLIEANTPGYRAIKYALFPPLGLASLAGYLDPDDEVELLDEHVQAPLTLDDTPDLLVMSVYITSARRAWEIADAYRARGTHVCVGGLHPTSLPDEAALHADTVFIGPGEGAWQEFLADFRAGRPKPRYQAATSMRTLEGIPPVRRDLIDRRRYLCPNSIVVSRGCPHHCDFCYKDAFYEGGRSLDQVTAKDRLHRARSLEEASHATHALEQPSGETFVAEQMVVEEVQVLAREAVDLGERPVDRLRVERAAALVEGILVAEVAVVRAAARHNDRIGA